MVERAIPRFPGPKSEWHFFLNTGTPGNTPFGGAGPIASTFDYWITSVDCYRVFASGGTDEFQVGFLPATPPLGALQVFFGGQVSPNTGLYFGYRGLVQWHNANELILNVIAGTWSAYVTGFFTSSANAQ